MIPLTLHRKKLVLVAMLAVAILNHASVAIGGTCGEISDFRFVRNLVPASQLSPLKTVTVPTHVQCGQLCLFLPLCSSFTFYQKLAECQLFLDDVTVSGNVTFSDVITITASRSSIPKALAGGCRQKQCPGGTACFQRGLRGPFCLPPPNTHVRLAGGASANEGRVEILVEGRWGTVCDDGFDFQDGIVVCRMLGLPAGSLTQILSVLECGLGTGPIHIDELGCYGNETSIFLCRIPNGIGHENCYHIEDVGVRCLP